MNNNFYLIGRIASHIDVTKEKNKFYEITIAVTRHFKNINGEYETDLIPVKLFGGIADNVVEYCNNGDLIGIKGRIQHIALEVDGQTFSKIELIAEKISYLSSKGE